MSRDEFTARVRREFPYEIEGGIEPLITTVLRAVSRYVTPGEWKDIASTLPEDLATMLPASS